MDATKQCGECGGTMHLDRQAQTEEVYHPGYHVAGRALPTRRVLVACWFCYECEHAEEYRPA
jgi:hypothetical protein